MSGMSIQGDITSNVDIQVPKKVRNNGTMFAHVFVTKSGSPPRPGPSGYNENAVLYKAQVLTSYSSCIRNTTRTLLSSAQMEHGDTSVKTCNFLKPKIVIRLVDDTTVYPKQAVPGDIYPYLQFVGKKYKPILFLDETWLLKEHLLPINSSAQILPLEVQYRTVSLGFWRLILRFDEALKMMEGMIGGESEEPDNIRRMLTETSPWLLLVTFLVTILHTLFDILAFRSDVMFWRSRKNMEGLSANNVLAEVICQLIILLYLWNNDAGWIIVITMAVGLAIQIWKAGIALRLKRMGKDSSTAQADATAMRWLSYVLYPLVLGYAVYSLVYKEHKDWYSWVLESMASAVYAFGFVLMTPQLYINYKLKSVANLPWRVFMYRACNTFIDDLFAFIIKMPTMHRLSAFRDDVVFIIYLVQRWQYPVDPTRKEGFDGEEDNPKKDD
uniref:Cleft lip and palate transmembrane protein 1-like protein n=1 Tax=Eutreptiella gymnastica TaxID=73025 RepID=A0A7S4CZR9_9EUGL